MKWSKRGHIFVPDGRYDWSVSHTQVPKADTISEEAVRIYFGTRDKEIRTVTSFIEVEADNPLLLLLDRCAPISASLRL